MTQELKCPHCKGKSFVEYRSYNKHEVHTGIRCIMRCEDCRFAVSAIGNSCEEVKERAAKMFANEREKEMVGTPMTTTHQLKSMTDKLKAKIKKQKRKIKHLRAIVDKLPVTKDGVPVVPGEIVWGKRTVTGTRDLEVVTRHVVLPDPKRGFFTVQYHLVGNYYSTKQAAEEAQK